MNNVFLTKDELYCKVMQLKSSFSVEGVPLIKSDRFSDAEIVAMRQESNAHISHWYRQKPTARTWTDAEIAKQIEVLLNTKSISEVVLGDLISKFVKNAPCEDKNTEVKFFKEFLYTVVGWTDEYFMDLDFWGPFNSAPYYISENDSNKKLVKAKELYGACGMDEIFGNKFKESYSMCYNIPNTIHEFKEAWDKEYTQREKTKNAQISPFNTLEDLENNIVAAKINEQAEILYLDKTKDFEQRKATYIKYGKMGSSIYHPSDRNLKKIFDAYFDDNDWLSHYQIINTLDVLDWWISELRNNRVTLNWRNPYHPEMDKTERKYTPSAAALNRLYKYYAEKLFVDGESSFEFDW